MSRGGCQARRKVLSSKLAADISVSASVDVIVFVVKTFNPAPPYRQNTPRFGEGRPDARVAPRVVRAVA